jgi:serine protease
MWAASSNANVTLDPGMIQGILRATARAFPDGSSCGLGLCGQGILDADAALAAAVDPETVLPASADRGGGAGGGGGCSLVASRFSRFDPLFVLLLMAAGLRRRRRKSGFPE